MEHTIKLDQSGQHNAKINRATRVTCSNLSRHMFIHTFAEMDTMEDLVIDSLGERCFNTGGEKVFGMIIAIISTNRNGVVTNAMQEVVSIEPLKLNDSREAESTSNFGAEWNKLKRNTMMMDVITVMKTQNRIGLVISQLHSLSPVLLSGTVPRKM
ncbi:hypothetical protein MTR_1g047230 [Medicago truncatula]|uniref:Uncharacterized protein n=1 Tax=Medicago truncatula TaxID=3880 RepID=A0A072VSZ4_MEDTR|nr:hypothetical protein MTR_1g047230 [Medicago truncatula]